MVFSSILSTLLLCVAPETWENEDEKQTQAGQILRTLSKLPHAKVPFQAFNILTRHLDLDPLDHETFIPSSSQSDHLEGQGLWYKLDSVGPTKSIKSEENLV